MRFLYFVLFTSFFLVWQSLSAEAEDLVQQIFVHNEWGVERVLYLYNSEEKKVLELRQENVTDSKWENKSSVEWIYNTTDNTTVQSYRIWKNGSWVDDYEIVTVFEKESLPISKATFVFDEQKEKVALEKREYIYNVNDQLSEEVFYKSENGIWEEQSKVEYSYDSQTSAIEEMTQSVFVGDVTQYRILNEYADVAHTMLCQQTMLKLNAEQEWINAQQSLWTYDVESECLVLQTKKEWLQTEAGMAWVNVQSVEYTYRDNKLFSETYRYWDAEYWKNDLRYLYEYTESGELQNKTTQFPIYNKWRNISSIDYQYEQSPRKETVSSVFEFWGGETDAPKFAYIPFVFNHVDNIETIVGEKIEILYKQPETQIPNVQFSSDFVNVFPNPSNGIYYIDTFAERVCSYSIMTMNGQLVEQKIMSGTSAMINISEHPAGIYVLKVQTEKGTIMKKLIKQQ